jgi:hypothetical protein
MSTLYLATNGKPIGRLQHNNGWYEFCYLQGVTTGVWGMPDLDKTYKFKELPPVFAKRVMPRSRPDYPEYMSWLGLPLDSSPLDILSRSGGRKVTDNYEVIPHPNKGVLYCLNKPWYTAGATIELVQVNNPPAPASMRYLNKATFRV